MFTCILSLFLRFSLFLFSFFEPRDYEVFRCRSFCMYAIWDSLSFLDVWIDVFLQAQEGFSHYFSSYFSPPLSLPSPLSLSLSTCCYIRCCLTSLLGSVLFFFNHFFLSVLQISRLLFVCLQRNWPFFVCHLESDVELFQWIFHFSDCLFQL